MTSRRPVREHRFIPGPDGQCLTCPLPAANRAHQDTDHTPDAQTRAAGGDRDDREDTRP